LRLQAPFLYFDYFKKGDDGMKTEEIREELFQLRDAEYRCFQMKLLPTVDPETIVGVRTPALRTLAKQLTSRQQAEDFLKDLPHRYFDENQLHAFLISEFRSFPACLEAVEQFLPYVDNWATCDQLAPKSFRRHRAELIGPIRRWVADERTYTVRFGLRMLMTHYLDEDFVPAFLELAASVRSEEYYVRMMVAWYFATALAKQYDAALPFLEDCRLDAWTHNKTIRKAIESWRVSSERKDCLRKLAIKGETGARGKNKSARTEQNG
jgi:3-methyladenine DNA glycosylase AlkD